VKKRRRKLPPNWLRRPLPGCPACGGRGYIPNVNIFSPCGSIQLATGVKLPCACVNWRRKRGEDLDDLRAQLAAFRAGFEAPRRRRPR
jgi:hypothetical protein